MAAVAHSGQGCQAWPHICIPGPAFPLHSSFGAECSRVAQDVGCLHRGVRGHCLAQRRGLLIRVFGLHLVGCLWESWPNRLWSSSRMSSFSPSRLSRQIGMHGTFGGCGHFCGGGLVTPQSAARFHGTGRYIMIAISLHKPPLCYRVSNKWA